MPVPRHIIDPLQTGWHRLLPTALASGATVTGQAIVKHLQVPETTGPVAREKRGCEVLYTLEGRRIAQAQAA